MHECDPKQHINSLRTELSLVVHPEGLTLASGWQTDGQSQLTMQTPLKMNKRRTITHRR